MSETTRNSLIAVLALAVLIGFPAGCEMHKHQKMAEGIKAGGDPIAVACAYRSSGAEPICITAAETAKARGAQ